MSPILKDVQCFELVLIAFPLLLTLNTNTGSGAVLDPMSFAPFFFLYFFYEKKKESQYDSGLVHVLPTTSEARHIDIPLP